MVGGYPEIHRCQRLMVDNRLAAKSAVVYNRDWIDDNCLDLVFCEQALSLV